MHLTFKHVRKLNEQYPLLPRNELVFKSAFNGPKMLKIQ
jgi:hypothetical protein